jgi:hypothetical protein
LIFYANFGWSISRFKNIQWEIITNTHTALWKLPPILVRVFWNLNFLHRLSTKMQKILKNKIQWQSVPYYPFSTAFLRKQNIPHLISILSDFRRTQNLTPLFTIQSLPLFRDKWILVTSSFYTFSSDLFQYYFTVTKFVVWPVPLRSSAEKFQYAPQIWYMCHKCCTFRLPLGEP